jgi:hypothetical protein
MHFDESKLLNYIRKKIGAAEIATIENHLASCQVCYDRYMALVKYEYESRIVPDESFVADILNKVLTPKPSLTSKTIRVAFEEAKLMFYDELNNLIKPVSISEGLSALAEQVTSQSVAIAVDCRELTLVMQVTLKSDSYSLSVTTDSPQDLAITCASNDEEIETIFPSSENQFQSKFQTGNYILTLTKHEVKIAEIKLHLP